MFLIFAALCVTACQSTPEAPIVPVDAFVFVATATAQPTTSVITLRVSGAARGITGIYTDATGNEVAIPLTVAATTDALAHANLPWEITVQMPIKIMCRQHINLSADNAFASGVDITAEMVVDGKIVNTITGSAPHLFTEKH